MCNPCASIYLNWTNRMQFQGAGCDTSLVVHVKCVPPVFEIICGGQISRARMATGDSSNGYLPARRAERTRSKIITSWIPAGRLRTGIHPCYSFCGTFNRVCSSGRFWEARTSRSEVWLDGLGWDGCRAHCSVTATRERAKSTSRLMVVCKVEE
jgi:hypothetical protein